MTPLTIAGLSRNGSRLLLVGDDGTEYSVVVDSKLLAALRGDNPHIGQLEIQMESALRPRDIQARIRAGESPEQVASAARTSVEAIMRYARPVLAERAHIADRAQRASLRRTNEGPGGVGRTLGDGVSAHLRPLHVDPDTVAWDAWRREDGRWILTAGYAAAGEAGTAQFAFDAPGNYVVTMNDEARWLVGELGTEAPDVVDDLDQARQRRLTAVTIPQDRSAQDRSAQDRSTGRAEPVEWGDDALELVAESQSADVANLAEDATIDLTETAREVRASEPPSRREVTKTRGRASVPSWDEIMFGGGRAD
ncbi:MAG: septation protein SepH [Nocardioides sp.]